MQRILFSFLTIRLSIFTRNKCKQSKEYFFHSSLSDFQSSLEINVNKAKNIFYFYHSSLSDLQSSLEINVNNQTFIFTRILQRILFSFLTIRLSIFTRNKCKQSKEYFLSFLTIRPSIFTRNKCKQSREY